MQRTRTIQRPLPRTKRHDGQRLVAAVVAVALVFGTPIGLSQFGLPFSDVDWAALPNQLRIGDVPRRFLVGIVTSLAWLLWANFMWALVVEWWSQRSGIQAPTIPTAPGTQYLARRIVSGLLFSVHSFGVMAMPPPDLYSVEPVVTVIDERPADGARGSEDADAAPAAPPTYVVGRGDTLMSIAAETLGDDDRWTEIRRLNVGQTRPDGSIMQPTETWVMLGQRLTLPDDAIVVPLVLDDGINESVETQSVASDAKLSASPTGGGTSPPSTSETTDQTRGRTIDVVAGDNFWTLASDALEDDWGRDVRDDEVAAYHRDLVEANRSALTSVPADPDLIFPGDRFVLPAVPTDPSGAATSTRPAAERAAGASQGAGGAEQGPASGDSTRDSVPADGANDSEGTEANRADSELFPGFVDSRDGGTLWSMVPDDRAGKPDHESEATGETGPSGAAGETGALGAAGETGPSGAAGETGALGAAGETGSSGAAGETGPLGAIGETGSSGATDETASGGAARETASSAGESGAMVSDSSRAGRDAQDGGVAESNRSVVVGTVGAGLLAAAFVRAFRRRRRIQWQQRQPGRIPEPLEATESLALARLEAIADYERLDSSEYTLTTYDVPDSTHIVVDDQEVSVFVPDEPTQMYPAPPATDDLEANFEIDERASAWVSLGHDESGADVVVNLATIERLWIATSSIGGDPAPSESGDPAPSESGDPAPSESGDPALVAPGEVVTTLATEMATSPLNDVRVMLVDPTRDLCLDRVVTVHDEAALMRLVEADSDGLDLAPVVASTIPLSDAVQRTLQRRRIPAVVVGSQPRGDKSWSCCVRPEGTWIDPIATLVQRDWFDKTMISAIAGATERSERGRDIAGPGSLAYDGVDTPIDGDGAAAELDDTEQPIPPGAPRETPTALTPDEHTRVVSLDHLSVVEAPERSEAELPHVKVLGRVEISGLQRRLESLRAMGLITYLAFHRDGADSDRLITWVWPDGAPPTRKAFANVVSRARKSLGTDANGEPYLQKADANGVYRLSKSVGTDFDDLVDILERIGPGGTEEQLGAYHAALELVRGVPFTGGGAHGFAWTDHGLRAHVDYTIDEAVHACADLAISVGDTEKARWATRIGLQVVPGCEGCYRRRFAAAAADENHGELRAAMAELERVVSADLGEPEASDAISTDLLGYYDSLLAKC